MISAFEIENVGEYGHVSLTTGKFFSTPMTQNWNVLILARLNFDQQMYPWKKSSSEWSWYLAMLPADVVKVAVYIKRGSHPKSLILNVQLSITKFSSLPHGVRISTLIYGATFILLMKIILVSPSLEYDAGFVAQMIGLSGLSFTRAEYH